MRIFHVAYTGDFLNENGQRAYGDMSLARLEVPYVRYRFLMHQVPPKTDDPVYWDRFYSMQLTAEDIRGANGMVVCRPRVKPSTFAEGAPELVVIGRSGVGYDKVDVPACTENDVALFNVPKVLDHSTAATALLFMLALAKRLPEQERLARANRWEKQASVMGSEIQGRTLGIVGLGNSGGELVRLVAPFAMRVIAHSPHADPAVADALGVRLTTLDEVFRESDFISLNARLRPDNRRMIGAAQFALMKPSAYFINVARGELIDQGALVNVLRERRIAGAALDVFEKEPPAADDPILTLDNVIVTPHWSASTTDVWAATGKATALGMLAAAQGRIPENVVNKEVLDRPGFQAKLAAFAVNRS